MVVSKFINRLKIEMKVDFFASHKFHSCSKYCHSSQPSIFLNIPMMYGGHCHRQIISSKENTALNFIGVTELLDFGYRLNKENLTN